ncbi:sugar ABC transporter substrate-binding protein [Amycolatopsis sp. FDAARGOS 1241]|uniref:sugar ABC transporter substrate-binding protein n=1 Tax=Amycolatopsis sp. FDAARGOS 1241 TaxID=2778070 RepID=UPI00195200B4|nr:sugar ABC transporter substrate-binding protein [Amycolatopsis sp. FDAARGOS 1241]QRP47619.1 sugar ABC transporter substrate-binding protein [Amycolatopsis sp. FDAARGOS 1241]
MRHPLPRAAGAVAATGLLLTLTACGGGFDDSTAPATQQSGPAQLKLMIAASGGAELKAVQDATAKWAAGSAGSSVQVIAANDLPQQLSQGFAAGSPPDVFAVDATKFQGYADEMLPYGDSVSYKDDLYPTLRTTFTKEGKLYCVPKDFSTLALAINTDQWTAAGLTDNDIPKNWDQLKSVAQKLTTGGHTGLVFNDTRDRVGAFLVQAGGWPLDADQKKATADSPQNLQALTYVRDLLASGAAKYPKQIGAGDSGEAFGQGKAAMSVDGNWLVGGMSKDYPNVKYKVVPLPAGPAGPGTLSFTQCWGIAAKSKFQDQAKQLVDALMQPAQELAFAKTFGVMPSRQSVRTQYQQQFPQQAAFLEGADSAHGPVTLTKMDPVLTDFDAQIQQLPGADPKHILQQLQTNTAAALGQ